MGFLKGCEVPEKDMSRELLGRRNWSGCATWRDVEDWLALPHVACHLLNRDHSLRNFFQATSQISSLSCLNFDTSWLQRPSYLWRTKLLWVEGRDPAGAHSELRLWMAAAAVFRRWFQALQEVAEHLNGGSTFTSAFIFPISAGQTEKLINCMKPK